MGVPEAPPRPHWSRKDDGSASAEVPTPAGSTREDLGGGRTGFILRAQDESEADRGVGGVEIRDDTRPTLVGERVVALATQSA